MNKKLFEKVKGLCKDTGLSEKYLKAITEKMGGSIEDDSTDDEAIESTANLIAEVAKERESRFILRERKRRFCSVFTGCEGQISAPSHKS